MPKKFQCPSNLKWARAMSDLYPPGLSKKVDALRECVREAEKKEKEIAKEE